MDRLARDGRVLAAGPAREFATSEDMGRRDSRVPWSSAPARKPPGGPDSSVAGAVALLAGGVRAWPTRAM